MTTAITLHARPSPTFTAKLLEAETTLTQAASELAPLTQASSLGAEDVVITHLINRLGLYIPVFVLNTGLLHAETVALLAQTRAQSTVPVTVYEPAQQAVIEFVSREGNEAMYRSVELRKACCHIRKVLPLERALLGQRAWVTGLRREQSAARGEVPLVDTIEARAKVNPLANWTWGDVWHYIQLNEVPYNPLHDQFFPSIGCAPCTRAISLGEDFRSGRWWWESSDLKECGLHSTPHASDSSQVAASAQAHFAEGEVKGSPEPGRSYDENAKECGLHVKHDEAVA